MITILAETSARNFQGRFYLMIGLVFLAWIYNNFAD